MRRWEKSARPQPRECSANSKPSRCAIAAATCSTGVTRSAKGSVERPGRNVRAKSGLNRVVLDSGFGLLRQMIVAKAEEAARTVVEVAARFSSQECSRCEHIARESRRRRRFCCVRCGHRNHADVNAALVIRGRAQLALKSELDPAEEAGRRGQEAAAQAHTTKNKGSRIPCRQAPPI